jgi:MFS superfamily sulfate permease-like transporter
MANTPGSPDPRFAGANNAWLVFRSLDSYRPRFLTCDLVAGLTLAAIAIPEQMATARLGGFSPEIGFFAFLGGSLAFAFFGNNRFLSCGADSTITPIFAGGLIILAASGSAEYAGLAAALALMVGLVLVAGIVLALLGFGATLLRHVPHAALGGVLLFVALRIIRFRQIVAIYRQSFGEFLLIVSSTAAIIILPIEQGAAIGIALSLLNGIWITTRARVLVFERVPGTSIWWPPSPHIPGEKEPNVIVAGFQAPLSFLNAYRFRRDILDALQSSTQKARLIVLEATGILEIDFTAAQVLSDLIRRCHADCVAFAITRLESIRAQDAVARFGIDELLGPGRMFRSVEEAIRALRGETQART